MSSKILAPALAAGGLLVAGCAPAAVSPTTYADQLQAFRDICVTPGSHGEILRAARASGWEVLSGDAVPAMVVGNGMVHLAQVRQGRIAGAPALIAVGELNGTSFCRVYFQPSEPKAMIQRLGEQAILGAPLGRPDDAGVMTDPGAWAFAGWHVSRPSQWRAVHYRYYPDGRGPNGTWQSIEITRPVWSSKST